MQRVLVIRGGAIGDFILTLPALGALRRAMPGAYIEVLGQPHRASLALHPAYADRLVDREDLDIYGLFSSRGEVSERLSTYLRSFEAIFAYLPDRDGILEQHLRRYCTGHVISWPPHPPPGRHATDHLLQPVMSCRPDRYDPVPHLYLSAEALQAAERFWRTAQLPAEGVIALHPGSGGASKLWPLPGWQHVAAWIAAQGLPCLVCCGPAEQEWGNRLLRETQQPSWPCAGQMPLTHLAAILARCRLFVGHDSGLTHLAAAVGTATLALFGPTDPFMWGPRRRNACVLRPASAGSLTLENLPPQAVVQTLHALWQGTFSFIPSRVDCTILTVPGPPE